MISTKKLATIGAAAALFAATAVPAFAFGGGGQLNFAEILNGVVAGSNTGGNIIEGEVEDGSSVKTGDAGTLVGVTNVANKNVNVSGCGCRSFQMNSAGVLNEVLAGSNTGGNIIGGEVEDGSSVKTGDATTGVVVANVVNKNVSFGFGFDDEE